MAGVIIAAAQFAPLAGEIKTNVRTVSGLIRQAGAEGARVVVFPELALTGYEPTLVGATPDSWLGEADARLEPIREACRETGAVAVVNGPVLRTEGRPGVTSLVIGADGELLARYDKTHLYGVEAEVFEPGSADGRFTVDGVRFALATCYDNRFPDIAERAAADGCTVYLASSALDADNDSFEEVYPVRAREFGLYVVLADLVGLSEAGPCVGRSGGWGPDGERIADAGPDREGFALVEVPVPVDPLP
ncbi:carbon-nitrogen hydrolase family protein [Streptomyces sp. NRRL WC-3742]|uniref:carbon-nitrogen hydrolase family protein n=1 Tax=Streptomyces sp. NRRL WC-3742 TaxID=1463934 RepID=UPI002D21833D|nr:carbon-nitrogen hydrolase family protein [Streptomyces sp. NRRL WC-3742]